MSYGKKCNIIFIRKVANRLHELEEKYKDSTPKKRADEINKQLLLNFCVDEQQIRKWKRIVKTADNLARIDARENLAEAIRPTALYAIAQLPEDKQVDAAHEIISKRLTTRQTKAFVKQALGKNGFKPQLFNVWNFADCDGDFGVDNYKGRIPGQIVQNILHYFTDEDDLIVDPMVGSGTTLDVCKSMNRECKAYDLNPTRQDITKHDITNGFPDDCKNCDLIFLDPPYFNMVYDFFKNVQEFYAFIKKLALDCFNTVKENGIVAFLMQDMTEKGNYCLTGECYRLFREVGFETIVHVSCPHTTQKFLHLTENAMTEKRLLGRNRDLYIFRKP
jgi:hypothetical protein